MWKKVENSWWQLRKKIKSGEFEKNSLVWWHSFINKCTVWSLVKWEQKENILSKLEKVWKSCCRIAKSESIKGEKRIAHQF